MSGVFIQILMTRFFDLVTDTNLKRWLQQDNLLRSQVVQATTQTPASRAKTARPIKGRKSRVAGERRVKNMQRREIHCTINARDVLLSVDFVTYMCRSAKFWLNHVGPMRSPPKFGPCEIFANVLLDKNWK